MRVLIPVARPAAILAVVAAQNCAVRNRNQSSTPCVRRASICKVTLVAHAAADAAAADTQAEAVAYSVARIGAVANFSSMVAARLATARLRHSAWHFVTRSKAADADHSMLMNG